MPRPADKPLVPIVIPDFGFNQQVGSSEEVHSNSPPEQGELTAWYQEPESNVEIGALLYQVSYSGVSIDVTSSRSGILKSQTAPLRKQITAGEIIGYFEPLAE